MDILILDGDGIGPEIAASCADILVYLNKERDLGLTLERRALGLATLAKEGSTLPSSVRSAAEAADGIVLAPLSTFSYPTAELGGVNASAEFRTGLDLFANFRPCRSRKKFDRSVDVDLVVVRENTEGFYACRTMHAGSGEFMPDPDTAFALRKITSAASAAIAHEALQLASARRKKLAVIHKANVLKLSDALFLQAVRSAAMDFEDVIIEELLVDTAAALLVRDPGQFDVLLTTNMFGDILSNEAAEIAGGLGMAPSLNAGNERAMAQAAHGSAPDIAGQNRANPTGLILSSAMLLDWLGRRAKRDDLIDAAKAIEIAIDLTLAETGMCTPDQGGSATTSQFTHSVIQKL
ncbi:isocitrate/isopropylmalate family dehydrogenase [Rhizobium pusense]|uniref:Isocitrate/isopropylmalate dehydrogenase family protein n=3 Tax=Hyphomicrobiales TaxID=356 RepID=A0A256GDW3_9HYPH|nr:MULTISPECIES: isocitrate/isopropylmalate family dehydrogenase [Hyphomicrobiales]QCM13557.1 isocitrate/isopropylmalate dehydrogenase family protein [Agrobacterium tumefaciens]KAB2702034.1 isocitrate/isopropylmalate dehydrogenase family protein [Brucella lupini]MCD4659595.1 isocitrate/isopropylmalate dehydrogenase family protein [Agrobacterium sp.]MDH0912984.1 isocitrate/isopropylmalate family dehydrogenase [Agrobacterium pusense]MDH1099245.1 isocitrate/isopropylmalate family dehydrogenase [A